MKKSFAYIIAVIALCAMPIFAATSFTGIVTDDMCGSGKHMMPGKSAALCVRECVKGGAKYALAVNGKVYILSGDTSKFDALAGQKATVTGTLNGKVLAVGSIAAAK